MKYGYGEFTLPDGRFYKEILLEDKEKEKESLNGQTGGYVKESENFERSMNFPLRPCRILNRDFCMVQMDCHTRQMKNPAEGSFHDWILKTACQTVCGDGFRAGSESIPSQVQIWEGTFISILNFNNFISASMPNTCLLS